MLSLFIKFCLRNVIYMIAVIPFLLAGSWAVAYYSTLSPVTVMVGLNTALALISVLASYLAFKNTLKHYQLTPV